MPAKERT